MDFDDQTYVSSEVPTRAMSSRRIVRERERLREKQRLLEDMRGPAEQDIKAIEAGFWEDVYHWSSSKDVFDTFRVRNVSQERGSITPAYITNFLGVHVGSKEAAQDRYLFVVDNVANPAKNLVSSYWPLMHSQRMSKARRDLDKEDLGKWARSVEAAADKGFFGGYTIPLKARLNHPYLYKSGDNARPLREIEMMALFSKIIREQKLDLYNDPQGTINAVRKWFTDRGYDHIAYYNQVEDPQSVSYLVLVPEMSLRFRTADFEATGAGPLAGSLIGGTVIFNEMTEDE